MNDSSRGPHQPAQYRPDVDGLRAVAILCVLVFHAFPSRMPGGFVGVDVFFVISGYLITGIIVRGLQSGRFSFATFYAKRIKRIFPALTFVLAATYVVGWRVLLPSEFSELGKHLAGGMGFVQNLVLWREAGYFDTASARKLLLHLWSLGIEEQFYLFFPLVMWGAVRFRVMSSVAVVWCLTLVCFALNVANVRQDPTGVYFLPYYRLWELTIGGVVAHLRPMEVPWSSRTSLSVAGLVMIAAAAFAFSATTPFPGWPALLPVCGTALVILAGPDAWINEHVLAQPVVVGIGLISYPLYLWHWPVLTYLRILDPMPLSRSLRFVGVLVSVALAWATYRLVEQPLSKAGRFSSKVVAGLAMAGALVGFVGLETYRLAGVPARFPPGLRELTTYKFDPTATYRTGLCYRTSVSGPVFHADDFSPMCGEPGKPSLLVWGDSFGAAVYGGVKAAFPEVSVLQFNQSLCPPLLDLDEDMSQGCPAMNAFVYALVKAHPPDKVLLVANWAAYDWKRLGRTITALHKAGVGDPVVIGALPAWDGRLPDIMARRALRDGVTAPPVRFINPSFEPQLQSDDEVRAFALENGADYVSPLRLLCDAEAGCLVRTGSGPEPLTPLAFDNSHLTDVGSRLLGRLMRESPTARGHRL